MPLYGNLVHPVQTCHAAAYSKTVNGYACACSFSSAECERFSSRNIVLDRRGSGSPQRLLCSLLTKHKRLGRASIVQQPKIRTNRPRTRRLRHSQVMSPQKMGELKIHRTKDRKTQNVNVHPKIGSVICSRQTTEARNEESAPTQTATGRKAPAWKHGMQVQDAAKTDSLHS